MKNMFVLILMIVFAITPSYSQTTIEDWIEAAEAAEAAGNWSEAGTARSNAAKLQSENGEFEKAGDNYKKAAENFRKDGRDGQADIEDIHSGENYDGAAAEAEAAGKSQKAKDLYKKSAEQYEKAKKAAMAEAARKKAEQVIELLVHATGTGNTTGNIANLTITNKGNSPVNILEQTVFIPSDGKYQPYITVIPPTTVPPGTTTIPLDGYCVDVHTPPVPEDYKMYVPKWIPVGDPNETIPVGTVSIIPTPPVPTFDPGDIPGIITSPNYKPVTPDPEAGIIITWPGTDIPVGGTFVPGDDPSSFAPVIAKVFEEVTTATKVIQQQGTHPTPFAPPKEYPAIVQNVIWMVTSHLKGDEYTKDDFADNLYDQFTTTSGKPIASLPKEQKEKIDEGIDQFWNTFTAVGVEAKVIRTQPEPEEQEPPIEISEKAGGCEGEVDLQMNPPYELNMKITEQWGSPQERQESIDAVNKALGQEIQITPEGAFAAYDINRHPTSSTSFWKAGNVGGFASAYAKTWFTREDGSSEWVWGTEKLETNADGTMDYSMKYTHDETCRAIVAGSALIRIRASSSAFDAMAGNTHLENDTEQLNFLRGTQYAAKISLEWLMKRSKGSTKQSFKDFVADDLKDKIKGEISDAVKAEVEAMVEAQMGQMLSQMGQNLNTLMNLELPSLEELIENTFGIEIPLLKDIEEFIAKGIEAMVNLPFVANTYARANGNLVVQVGGNTGSVLAQTFIHYSRQSTEETKDAMKWKGEDCKEDFVSDAQPDALTIHTEGFSNMVAHAESKFGFGNGQAEAFLESMNLQILSGICICPGERKGIDQSSYELTVQGHMEWYTADEGQQQALESALEPMLQQVEDQMIEELDGMSEDAVNNLTADQFEKMLADKVRAWGDANKFAWSACQN